MSAFVVSDNLIQGICNFYLEYFPGSSVDKTEELGKRLLTENYNSVNFRYKDSEKPYEFKFKKGTSPDPVQVIKHIHCLAYQSCEHDEWESSIAHYLLKGIRKQALYRLGIPINQSWEDDNNIQGYELVAWS